MSTLESTQKRLQVDWLISNLRWLLLVSVALISLLDFYINHGGFLDTASFLPQIVLLAVAAFYNLAVMLLISYNTLSRIVPVMTLLIDTTLTIGFVIASGGLESPLLFFALFPILTAALRFPWMISLLIAVAVVFGCGLAGYLIAPSGTLWSDLLPFMARSLVLLLAALISGLVGSRIKQAIARTRRLEEEAELRRLRTAHEQARVIFELASTLSATLNYNKVLEAVLEVGDTGMRELGPPESDYVSMVMLFSHNDLRIVASRHLSQRDQNVVFQGRRGVLAQALTTAEAVITDDPAADPELGQLVAMHNCRQAIVVPLRAGFENFGVVVFGSLQPDTYTEDHQDLLIAICNQAVVALQNAQLYQSLREEKERIVAVEEDARKKLARDLHDGPTQSIASIAMRVNYARMLLEKDPTRVGEELAHIEELARRTTKEIRHMLFTLRPLILETQGLQAALKQYISKLAETDTAPIHMEAAPKVDQLLDRNTQGVIFYILEEAIRNARKHARAENIWVRLYLQNGTFVAEVEDDGCGFDVDAVQVRYDERGSLGVINMYERAELIGGKLTIASGPGEGTRVTLTVPLQGGQARA
ncbi:MAG TPA: GAF domain-containing sensor histidine kinase [Thermoflexia bacterium]|nr:GAF domain-containing sensor histidine kinase [Thermoflexia bacterium]